MKSTKLENIGKKFGKMTILGFKTARLVNCQCDCGNVKTVAYYDLLRGRVISCKCHLQSPEYAEKCRQKLKRLKELGKITKGKGREPDEMTNFRYLLYRIRAHRRKKKNDLTLQDLKDQWEKQDGTCAYSGLKLQLQFYSNKFTKVKPWLLASVDRIDSSIGYTKDNIHFVSRTLNYAKNKISDSEMREFIAILRGK